MKRRTMLLGLTTIMCCLYSLAVSAVFSTEHLQEHTVLLQKEDDQIPECLFWLQAGVFKDKHSYENMKKMLEDQGLSVYEIELDGLVRVIVQPESSEDRVDQLKEELALQGIETIKRQTELSEEQKALFVSGKMQALLEGVCSQ